MRHKLSHLFQQRNSKPFLLLEIGILHMRLHAIDAGRDPIRITKLREEDSDARRYDLFFWRQSGRY